MCERKLNCLIILYSCKVPVHISKASQSSVYLFPEILIRLGSLRIRLAFSLQGDKLCPLY